MAFRCAFDKRVAAAVCYFATDIHSKTLGAGGDDSLKRVGDIKGELVMVSLFGARNCHCFCSHLCLPWGDPVNDNDVAATAADDVRPAVRYSAKKTTTSRPPAGI